MTARELALEVLALTDRQDWAARERLMTDDFELRVPGAPPMDRSGSTEFGRAWLGAFSDSSHTFKRIVASDTEAMLEGAWAGTHTSPLATPDGEVPPTGATVELEFVGVFATDGDRIRSMRLYFDQMAFLAQLGLVPAS